MIQLGEKRRMEGAILYCNNANYNGKVFIIIEYKFDRVFCTVYILLLQKENCIYRQNVEAK